MAAVLSRVLLILLFFAACNGLKMPVRTPISSIEGLVSRILGKEYVSQFEYEVIPPDPASGHDVFVIDVNPTLRKPVLRGNNGVALASALNFYLKYNCNCSISWGRDGTGDQLNLPQPLPLPSTTTNMVSPVKYRYYQNVCTVSYSMVWWNFSRWEREIDWMAMNGLNLILSFTGQEYIWQKFYTQIGLNDTAIKAFFSGPAFLAWQRMGNLRRWGGPLDDGWILSQANLQKQILARVREFGMINVLPGFAGHVPAALKEVFPNAGYSRNTEWAGFNSTYSDDYLLQPNGTTFMELGILYYQMLIDEYGTDHVFNCDTYNEMHPDITNLTYLTDVNKAIYQTMAAVDTDAVFLMQGWLFHDTDFWTNERIKAFLSGIPNDKMLILDLNSEQSPIWSRTDSYFGKPFIWCLLHNFGGTRGIYGNLTTVATSPVKSLNTPGSTMVGVGITPEAIEHNPVIYDLMGEMSWRSEIVADVPTWVLQYAARRYGSNPTNTGLRKAWLYLLEGAYQYHWSWLLKGLIERAPEFSMDYYSALSATNIALAWEILATEASNGSLDVSIGPLRYDVVDFGRQMLVNLFVDLHSMYTATYNRYVKDSVNTSMQLLAIQSAMLKLFDDLDMLLATNTNFLFGHWIADARASVPSTSPVKAVDNAEFNARNQVTMWGPVENIEDYASKEWAGLVKDYYKDRWALFTDLVRQAVIMGTTFDQSGYEAARLNLEQKFSYTIKSYPTTPQGELLNVVKVLISTYMDPMTVKYEVYTDTDANGNDIIVPAAWNKVPGQLKYLCNVNPDCKGFNSNGYLKTSVTNRSSSQGTLLYVKT